LFLVENGATDELAMSLPAANDVAPSANKNVRFELSTGVCTEILLFFAVKRIADCEHTSIQSKHTTQRE
jgi:hypothetical protein